EEGDGVAADAVVRVEVRGQRAVAAVERGGVRDADAAVSVRAEEVGSAVDALQVAVDARLLVRAGARGVVVCAGEHERQLGPLAVELHGLGQVVRVEEPVVAVEVEGDYAVGVVAERRAVVGRATEVALAPYVPEARVGEIVPYYGGSCVRRGVVSHDHL